MAPRRTGFSIDLHYRFERPGEPRRTLTHPRIAVLRAVHRGGSIQAAAKSLRQSYRHVRGLLRDAEEQLGCGLFTWVRGEGSTLTDRGLALLHPEDLALQIESLRSGPRHVRNVARIEVRILRD
ncbi:MAG TPA: LysR family transcriptional regulator [Methylibium sp.]|uniref:winged helix-turn-helix domain-containing protein n=1 Tax=Methylibium sp. TaxID=2067992 RepID=UPI002DB8A922|nr:LysR family transcriptional regulator [Methylibium sp.]HEU4457721.1 LysR family transcriptional regulator [Methylibium sp.]